MNHTPLILIVLDGWGFRQESVYNAISHAKTPNWDHLWANHPHALLEASGRAVGLPDNQMGNSEVGHLHISAGRVIFQDLTLINQAIQSRTFFENKTLISAIHDADIYKKTLHIMGLCSDGGIHSHFSHLEALIQLCQKTPSVHVCLHLFLDGRDTPPKSANIWLQKLNLLLKETPNIHIGSISGRFYAMDRDNRWDRTEQVYNLLTTPKPTQKSFTNAEDALHFFYEHQKTDEFIPPSLTTDFTPIEDGDSVIFFNFRSDRARQLTRAFIDPDFNQFTRKNIPDIQHMVTFTEYSKTLNTEVAFPPQILKNTLGEVISKAGLSQLRLAETEKYAHVTFFFNGGREMLFDNEDRILIPSPMVSTYDETPEMSAANITDTLINTMLNKEFDFIVVNYANADMVGHTGDLPATVKAIECLDSQIKRIVDAANTAQCNIIITADHGNAELMFDEDTNQPHTAHTSLPVPFLFIGNPQWQSITKCGDLTDVAPTILTVMDLPIPDDMTGKPLLKNTLIS